jgi:hypothetical protein
MSKPQRPKRRMLLVASIGVATVSYAVAACEKQPAGNLAPPQPPATQQPVGNLAAPPDQPMPSAEPTATASTPISPTTGNLMAPVDKPTPTPSASASTTSTTTKPVPPRPPHAGNLMAPPPKK